jgi:D-lactate dehydrogenase (cytochrome)
VNILPRSGEEYLRVKGLYGEWAKEALLLGGTVSAEHSVGKLKRGYLKIMYGERHMREMRELKAAFDPKGLLGKGTMFALDE